MRKVQNNINKQHYQTNNRLLSVEKSYWAERCEDGIGNFTNGFDNNPYISRKQIKYSSKKRRDSLLNTIDMSEETCEGAW